MVFYKTKNPNMAAPDPFKGQDPDKSIPGLPKPDPEKLNVYFSAPSNCQFYFGVDAKKNKETSGNLSELELLQGTCSALSSKVTLLETTNAQLLRKLLSLEERLGALEGESERCGPRKGPKVMRRGDSIHSGENNNESMETSSDVSTITGDVIFLEEPPPERPVIRTATPSPALSAGGLTPFKIVAKPGNQVNGVTALAMSKTYPGRLSCVFEIVNWVQSPLMDPQSAVGSGVLESIPQQIDIAKAFGIWDNGSKLSVALSYRIGHVRLAFYVYIDDSQSYFQIGFVPCHEPSPQLVEVLERRETWVDVKMGSPRDDKLSSAFGNIRLTGTLSTGKKTLLEIGISKI
ncbi:unnamed protein product [Allacma fusca]|uniref:Uncharacterized protein n=1 Tax=Allacma fusca TaxID=39272 RepID=A0A8J2Q268_9HEXA|nr:unnamed protein product [Allacma fusca]